MLKKKSFTLIELLVVIAIIAILAAILLPALNKARLAGKVASCSNNQKQLTFEYQRYSDDYDEWILPCWGLKNPANGVVNYDGSWQQELRRRIFGIPSTTRYYGFNGGPASDKAVFECAAETIPVAHWGEPGMQHGHFGANSKFATNVVQTTYMRSSEVSDASSVLLLSDFSRINDTGIDSINGFAWRHDGDVTVAPPLWTDAVYPKGTKAGAGYWDGHVAQIDRNAIEAADLTRGITRY